MSRATLLVIDSRISILAAPGMGSVYTQSPLFNPKNDYRKCEYSNSYLSRLLKTESHAHSAGIRPSSHVSLRNLQPEYFDMSLHALVGHAFLITRQTSGVGIRSRVVQRLLAMRELL